MPTSPRLFLAPSPNIAMMFAADASPRTRNRITCLPARADKSSNASGAKLFAKLPAGDSIAMKPEHVRLLYDYYTWANNRTLRACAALTEEQFTYDLGSSFRSVRDTLVHLFSSGWFWHERWQGRAPQRPDFSTRFKDVAGVREWANGIDRDLHQFVDRMRAADLESTLEYRTTEGEPAARQFWQMLEHVVNHGSYHRGQITTMLRQLGAKTVAFDLIFYLREDGVKLPSIAPGLD